MAYSDLAERDIQYTIHPYTNLALHEERGPLVITRGEGIYVYDEQNNRILEGLAGLWCTSLGFSEQRLIDAATAQLKELPYMHTFAHRSTSPVIELSEKLIEVAPSPMVRPFFVNSGSEAIDTAIKMIWYYNNAIDRPEKKKIISRRRGYHGVTVAGSSLTAIPLMQNDFDVPLDRMLQTDTPSYYRHGAAGETEEEFATSLAKSLEDQILAEGPDTVAAFFAEPVMGAGGVITPPATYFEKIQAVLKKYDVLLVADEVICGFGRTGNWWGCETYDITPDIVTCAKQLSSAYLPIAAVMVSEEIFRGLQANSQKHGAFGMGYTYGGHPVAAAVALETIKIYQERETISHVQNIAPQFQSRLAALGDHPLVGEARGVGLIGGLELVANKSTKEQHPIEAKAALQVADRALDHGLVVRGLPGDSVGICPPLIIEPKQIDELFDKLERALDDVHRDLRM